MKIIDFDWNSFFVELPKQVNEDQNTYLKKAQDCLREFYKTNTESKEDIIDIFWMLKGELEWLMEEQNFCDMDLKTYCDVKYKVRPNGMRDTPAGIWIYSHRMESRRSQVKYLKEEWSEFKYPPDEIKNKLDEMVNH